VIRVMPFTWKNMMIQHSSSLVLLPVAPQVMWYAKSTLGL